MNFKYYIHLGMSIFVMIVQRDTTRLLYYLIGNKIIIFNPYTESKRVAFDHKF